jgi:peptidoglycan-N-acetylglucosamine deacetylase
MEAHAPVVKQLAKNRLFELASHSYTHPHLDQRTPEQVERQFTLAQKTFVRLTGHEAALFRPPFGDLNASVVEAAWRHKLRTVTWDLPSGDPDPTLSLENLVKRTVRDAKGGSVIVLHMNGRGIHTAEALPQIIDGLKARGFQFTTVGELLKTYQAGR